ncbi:diguanylate cyclase [Desulfonema ishimotonii]|uniref:Diguanylate cyclase n=1 Tax=Desulfonema ishimotonii TaxID=45657 RepID=A0A401FYY8_9BACT|nr:NifB/NifX family molybdenum-iron cluster-binding protein [Desulfonema ishimotonii]GBC62163.1 diguanylate cyclase [Desulfonema ishimotonii]
MKIAFPTQKNSGLDSPVYSHFGTAQFFVILDTETDDSKVIQNSDLNHTHGNCQPLSALGGETVDSVVVGGIGRGALNKLNFAGVTAYRAVEGTVSENLDLIKTGKLPKFSPEMTCSGHHGHDGCIH